MPLAGELAVAPYRTTYSTTSSTSTFTTTETVTDTISANLINGETYSVDCYQMWNGSNTADHVLVTLREDNLTGTARQQRSVACTNTSRWFGTVLHLEYTAAATGAKTFVVTGVRVAGAGNITRGGSADAPSYIVIQQVS